MKLVKLLVYVYNNFNCMFVDILFRNQFQSTFSLKLVESFEAGNNFNKFYLLILLKRQSTIETCKPKVI